MPKFILPTIAPPGTTPGTSLTTRDGVLTYNRVTRTNFLALPDWKSGMVASSGRKVHLPVAIATVATDTIWCYPRTYTLLDGSSVEVVYVTSDTKARLEEPLRGPSLVPGVADLREFRNAFMKGNGRKLYSVVSAGTGQVSLAAVLMPFLIVPGMEAALVEYFKSPDADVVATRESVFRGQEGGAEAFAAKRKQMFEGIFSEWPDRVGKEEVVFKENEWKFLMYCILISYGEKQVHELGDVLRNRLKEDFLEDVIHVESLTKVSKFMRDYPKLKKTLAGHVLTKKDPFSVYLRQKLEASNLSNFTCVLNFMRTLQPTALHVEKQVLKELFKFEIRRHQLMGKYGATVWFFHKLLFPEERTFAPTELPTLVAASKVWSITAFQHSDWARNHVETAAFKSMAQLVVYRQKALRLMREEFIDPSVPMVPDCKMNLSALSAEDWKCFFLEQ